MARCRVILRTRISLWILALFFAFEVSSKAPGNCAELLNREPEFNPDQYSIVTWNSKESEQRISRSVGLEKFSKLIQKFVAQEQYSCGLTSATIIFNTLFDTAFVMSELMNSGVVQVMGPDRHVLAGVKKGGFNLEQLDRIVGATEGMLSRIRYVNEFSDSEVKAVRQELVDSLNHPSELIVINFFRPTFGQLGGGHYSPLAAYDPVSDSFLILEVNPNKTPWYWVRTDLLVKAMGSFDSDATKNRGFLLLNRRSE